MRFTPLPVMPVLAVVVLSACLEAAPEPEPVGTVEHAGITYPVISRGEATWMVRTERRFVPCRAPTLNDCYWSLRNFLQAQKALDDLG